MEKADNFTKFEKQLEKDILIDLEKEISKRLLSNLEKEIFLY